MKRIFISEGKREEALGGPREVLQEGFFGGVSRRV